MNRKLDVPSAEPLPPQAQATTADEATAHWQRNLGVCVFANCIE
ncbi:hypothetical protein OKW41_004983 [Paraburkholderia sp. UCT70]